MHIMWNGLLIFVACSRNSSFRRELSLLLSGHKFKPLLQRAWTSARASGQASSPSRALSGGRPRAAPQSGASDGPWRRAWSWKKGLGYYV